MQTKRDKAQGLDPMPQYGPEQVDACTQLLVETGSHLYGLSHEGSDHDYWRVVPDEDFAYVVGRRDFIAKKHKAFQILENGDDVTVLSSKTFQGLVFNGSRMALEAMFAPSPLIDRFPDYRRAYRASMNGQMVSGFLRSIADMAYGNTKRRRHAIRLSLNLRSAMLNDGRYSPTLSAEEIRIVKEGASSSPLEFMELIDAINHYDVVPHGWNIEEMESWFNESE